MARGWTYGSKLRTLTLSLRPLTLARLVACSALLLACQKLPTEPSEAERLPAAAKLGGAAEPRLEHVTAVGQLGPGRGTLLVGLKAPRGSKLTDGSPLVVHAHGQHLQFPPRLRTELDIDKLPIRLPVEVADGATGPVDVDLIYYTCETTPRGACRRTAARLRVDLDLSGDAAGGEAYLAYEPTS